MTASSSCQWGSGKLIFLQTSHTSIHQLYQPPCHPTLPSLFVRFKCCLEKGSLQSEKPFKSGLLCSGEGYPIAFSRNHNSFLFEEQRHLSPPLSQRRTLKHSNNENKIWCSLGFIHDSVVLWQRMHCQIFSE